MKKYLIVLLVGLFSACNIPEPELDKENMINIEVINCVGSDTNVKTTVRAYTITSAIETGFVCKGQSLPVSFAKGNIHEYTFKYSFNDPIPVVQAYARTNGGIFYSKCRDLNEGYDDGDTSYIDITSLKNDRINHRFTVSAQMSKSANVSEIGFVWWSSYYADKSVPYYINYSADYTESSYGVCLYRARGNRSNVTTNIKYDSFSRLEAKVRAYAIIDGKVKYSKCYTLSY